MSCKSFWYQNRNLTNASFLALPAALAGVLGIMVTGASISYLKMKLTGAALIATAATACAILGSLVNMFNYCSPSVIAGISFENK